MFGKDTQDAQQTSLLGRVRLRTQHHACCLLHRRRIAPCHQGAEHCQAGPPAGDRGGGILLPEPDPMERHREALSPIELQPEGVSGFEVHDRNKDRQRPIEDQPYPVIEDAPQETGIAVAPPFHEVQILRAEWAAQVEHGVQPAGAGGQFQRLGLD